MLRTLSVTRLRYFLLLWGLLVLVMPAAAPVYGQTPSYVSRHDLPKFYREARLQMQFDQILSRVKPGLQALPPMHLASPADTVALWIARQAFNYTPPPKKVRVTSRVETWKLVRRIERHQFSGRFDTVKWAYLGNNYLTPIDTSFTPQIRARMQARFGAPTRTLVELDYSRPLSREEYIQFEYWFIVNDSIPMIVMDVNGPFDRGLVVACDHQYRNILYTLRQSFLGTLLEEETPAPYVDYYYNYPARRWYRTGFDGRQFFTDPIGQPNLARGRPQLAPAGE